MAAIPNELYQRKCSLLLVARQRMNNPSAFVAGASGDHALDLSDMHITFHSKQEDEESPNSCSIRVHNLSQETLLRIQGEYSRVVLQAGYQHSAYGVIFDGTIRQFRIGKENATTSFLDILAADGDLAYNFSIVNKSLKAGSTPQQRIEALIDAMTPNGVTKGEVLIPGTGGILPRGKVLFGLAKGALRAQTANVGATWNIQAGRVNVTPLDEYRPGEAVVLTSATGLIGIPEQTQQGVYARCLINPRLNVGGLVKIDNRSINETIQQRDLAIPGAQLPYDKYVGIQQFADVTADGLYRVYVAEYQGDTRGLPWWADLTLLAVDPATLKVKTHG